MKSTACDHSRIRPIGQSIHLMFLSFELIGELSWSNPGYSASLPALLHMRLRLDSQKPETYYNDGFIVCWLLHGPTDIRRLFSAHGVAALSPMIPIVPPSIFGKLWKINSTERFPTWCLQSRIGRRKGNFLGLSVRFSPQLKSEQFYPIEESDRIIVAPEPPSRGFIESRGYTADR